MQENILNSKQTKRERERESSSGLNLSVSKQVSCHLKRKRSIQNANSANNANLQSNVNLHKHLDTSVSAKPQYDNVIDCHADFDKSARNDSNANSRNDRISPSLANGDRTLSPSLAEGDKRGWVSLDSTSKTSLRNSKADFSIASLANAKSNNANFANTKSTHPQTPSAIEGALRGVATLAMEGGLYGLPRGF